MKLSNHILFACIIIILLIPILFFPISNDLSIFALGGRTILNENKLYVDFIDIKQPLIYLITAINQVLFGSSEFSFRLFDFIWQLLTALSIIIVYSRINKDLKYAYLTASIYCLLYAVLHYSQTYQCEGFVGLPLIWLLYLQYTQSHKMKNYFFQGTLLGSMIALKFTFGIVLFAMLSNDILNKISFPYLLKKYSLCFLGLVIAFTACSFLLLDKTTLDGFLIVLDYLKHYNEYSYITLEWLKYQYYLLNTYLSDTLSLSVLFSVLIGIYYSLQKQKLLCDESKRFLQISIIYSFFLFLSIIFEKKFIAYHFSRLYVLIAIISSIGLVSLFKILKNNWKEMITIKKILIIIFISVSFLFSPLIRYANLYVPILLMINDREQYDNYYQRNDAILLRKDFKNIALTIKESSKQDDYLFIISIGAMPIYYFLDANQFSHFASSSFFLSYYIPQKWREILFKEFEKAKWLIIQTNDIHPLLTGHWLSSWEAVQKDSSIYDIIRTQFIRKEIKGNFCIFKRK